MRIAILGVAHMHADAYVRNLRAAGAEVAGAYDWDAVRGQAWSALHGVPFQADAAALLASGIAAAVVCAETAHHRALVELAAAAGVDVLCEKPLGVALEDSRAIVRCCADAGVRLMTAFPSRFNPAIARVRELLQGGALGTVRALTGTNQSVMPLRERAWFADRQLAGGGAMMDHIVHLADAFSWIAGEAPTEVYAVANRIVHSEVVTVETAGLVMLGYPSGLYASIDCSWNRPLDYPTWGGLALSLVADGGTVDLDAFRQRLTQFGGDRGFGWVPWGVDVNQRMIDEFLAAVRERRQPSVSGEDGLLATTIAISAMQSAETGLPVRLPIGAAA